MTQHLKCAIPKKATRAVILIPHADTTAPNDKDRTHPLSEVGVDLIRRAKFGTSTLVQHLAQHFGTVNVLSGQEPKNIMTAFIGGPTSQFATNPLLDGDHNDPDTFKKATKKFTRDLINQPLTLAFASPPFIGQMLASSSPNVVACRSLKPGIEAAVVFLGANGKIVGAQKKSLLAVA